MKKKTFETHGQKIPGMPFMGEMMTCKACNKQQKSDPKVESNWTSIQADNQPPIYICPDCWDKMMGVKR